MRTIAKIVRKLDKNDYFYIKEQAKTRRTKLKDLAKQCGCSYKQFLKYFKGKKDSTMVAEILLAMGYTLKEVRNG